MECLNAWCLDLSGEVGRKHAACILWFGFEEDFVRYLMADGIHMPSKGAKDDAASDGSWGSGSFRMQWWMM